MTTPVQDGPTIARLSVDDALRPLVLTKQGGSGAIRFYWQRQSVNTYPCVIHHAQDPGGDMSFLNSGAWEGLWTVQAFAKDQDTADDWLNTIKSGMDALALPTGYTNLSIQADWTQNLLPPPEQDLYAAGAIWRIRITRS